MDVLFQPGPAPTLTSITVAPASSTAQAGGTQQFTATGTYSNRSTQDITSQVNWASSNTAVATINTSGLASATSAGTTTISATMSSVTGSATLTVQAAALAISTSSLPNGTVKFKLFGDSGRNGRDFALYLVNYELDLFRRVLP